ncbi:hypothetical protein EIP86_006954 [Pleurotus ostreatoroseus]|nr:hypothetical protein EIP86_006954 [Pleurotus ostreatoroseus]
MNWKRFNEELRERMNIPDETDEEFLARMTEARQNAKRSFPAQRSRTGSDACNEMEQRNVLIGDRQKPTFEDLEDASASSRSAHHASSTNDTENPPASVVPEPRPRRMDQPESRAPAAPDSVARSLKRAAIDADLDPEMPQMKRKRHEYEANPCRFHTTTATPELQGPHGSPQMSQLSKFHEIDPLAEATLAAQCEKTEHDGTLAGRPHARSVEASKLALTPPHVEQRQASTSATTGAARNLSSQEHGKAPPKSATAKGLPVTPAGQKVRQGGPGTSATPRCVDQSHITTPGGNTTAQDASLLALLKEDEDVGTSKGRKRKGLASKQLKVVALKKPPKATKSPSMLPSEYVQYIQDQFESGQKKYSNNNFLAGKVIYYYSADQKNATLTTKERMAIIVKYGGTLLPKFDNDRVTQIVVADGAGLRGTLRSCGVERLEDLRADIPILKWSWVGHGVTPNKITGKGRCGLYHNHAAFKQRVLCDPAMEEPIRMARERAAAAATKKKGKGAIRPWSDHDSESEEEYSKISEFTEDKIVPPAPLRPSWSSTHAATDDPLAEFYDQARAEAQAERGQSPSGQDEGIGETETVSQGLSSGAVVSNGQKSSFQCDNPSPVMRGTCPNQDVVDRLTELKNLHATKLSEDDKWRVYAYNRAIPAVRAHPTRITSLEEAFAIRNIGKKTAEKIMEIIETGKLRRIAYEKTPDVAAMNIFMGIYGVGKTTAYQWYHAGCKTLEDVRAGKGNIKVSPAQMIGLRYYDDINSRMPRDEAGEIYNLIKPIARRIDPKLVIEIMGSYRRSMRLKANKMGYSLNQRGLYHGVIRNPSRRQEKLENGIVLLVGVRRVLLNRWSSGQILASETEEEIFRILGEQFLSLEASVGRSASSRSAMAGATSAREKLEY